MPYGLTINEHIIVHPEVNRSQYHGSRYQEGNSYHFLSSEQHVHLYHLFRLNSRTPRNDHPKSPPAAATPRQDNQVFLHDPSTWVVARSPLVGPMPLEGWVISPIGSGTDQPSISNWLSRVTPFRAGEAVWALLQVYFSRALHFAGA